MIIKSIFFLSLIFVGCANVSSSRISYIGKDGSMLTLEIPKEIEAKKMKVSINAQQGTAEITAESWVSRNQGTIKEEANRQAKVLARGSTLVEKTASGVSEGLISGAKKGIIP